MTNTLLYLKIHSILVESRNHSDVDEQQESHPNTDIVQPESRRGREVEHGVRTLGDILSIPPARTHHAQIQGGDDHEEVEDTPLATVLVGNHVRDRLSLLGVLLSVWFVDRLRANAVGHPISTGDEEDDVQDGHPDVAAALEGVTGLEVRERRVIEE